MTTDFTVSHRRNTDPETSAEAAASVEGTAPTIATRLLDHMLRWPDVSFTQDDLADELSIDRSSVHKRLSDLQNRGEIEPTGTKRRSPVTGRLLQEYRLAGERQLQLPV